MDLASQTELHVQFNESGRIIKAEGKSATAAVITTRKLTARCPGCGKEKQVPAEFAGRRLTCPRCRTEFDLPTAPSPPPAELPAPIAADEIGLVPLDDMPVAAESAAAVENEIGLVPFEETPVAEEVEEEIDIVATAEVDMPNEEEMAAIAMQDDDTPPPSPRRIVLRALALIAVAFRAILELEEHTKENLETHGMMLQFLQDTGVNEEFEAAERKFVVTALGKAKPKRVAKMSWRTEGAAVLAWALGRFDLPAYDQMIVHKSVSNPLGFCDFDATMELLKGAEIQEDEEINRLASHLTIVSWRLRQYELQPEPMDFAGYLRDHPAFKPHWLDGLRFLDGDLAFGDAPIAALGDEARQSFSGIAVERQTAAYWLQGDADLYSQVDPCTILTACL